jgi:hypothetical protein
MDSERIPRGLAYGAYCWCRGVSERIEIEYIPCIRFPAVWPKAPTVGCRRVVQ